jgi:hypothetical protein
MQKREKPTKAGFEAERVDARCPDCLHRQIEGESLFSPEWNPELRRFRDWPKCETCRGTGRVRLTDDQRRDPYDDPRGARVRIEQARSAT